MTWTVSVPQLTPVREAAHEAQLEHGDGRVSIAGAPAVDHPAVRPGAKAPGLYGQSGPESDLLALPDPTRLGLRWRTGMTVARELDLRAGVLRQEIVDGDARLEVTSFCSLARPGTYALRAEGDPALLGDAPPLRPPAPVDLAEAAHPTPASAGRALVAEDGEIQVLAVSGHPGGAVVAGVQRRGDECRERIAIFATDPEGIADEHEAIEAARVAQVAGFDALLTEQRDAWARRWERCDVRIEGDDVLQGAVRFALFHLNALVASDGEAALGARGTTGHAYRGHVFWDADVFVLPFFAATYPPAARAMLRYRARRLPAARAHAARLGHAGARFPWESAATGEDVTPTSMIDHRGEVVRIVTGELEEHVTADVAWAAAHYLAWTDDKAFARGDGLALMVETARYWASRVERDDAGRGHIRHVIGPDEYHEDVDDNAYTNVMARWNLRAAASHVERYGHDALRREAVRWREIAETIVDNFDSQTGLYEQFAGFFELEPLLACELGERPFSGPMIVGYDATEGGQLVKQHDVVMLGLNVREEFGPGSFAANVAFYEPRTTHESSLSPGSSAEALARVGRCDEAVRWLRVGALLDLPDLAPRTDGMPVSRAGLHTAALGNTWRALAYGFMGLWPRADALHVDPRLPSGWEALELSVRYRGRPLRLRATARGLDVSSPSPLWMTLRDGERIRLPAGTRRLALA